MLRKFTPKVPKNACRRKLIREGCIKSILISKNADYHTVHSKIKSAFSVNNFLLLDYYNGHHLREKFVVARLASQRCGYLYLCEVSYIHMNIHMHVIMYSKLLSLRLKHFEVQL